MEKIYRHRTAGARFIFPDGTDVSFAGGVYRTENLQHQQELDRVANLPASQIFTTETPPVAREEAVVRKDLMEGATGAFDAANKIAPGAKTVPMPVPGDSKPTLQALQGGEGAANVAPPVGGKSAIDAAKTALAERQAKTADVKK